MLEYAGLAIGLIGIGVGVILHKKLNLMKIKINEEIITRKQQDDKLYYLVEAQYKVMTNQPTNWELKQQQMMVQEAGKKSAHSMQELIEEDK